MHICLTSASCWQCYKSDILVTLNYDFLISKTGSGNYVTQATFKTILFHVLKQAC